MSISASDSPKGSGIDTRLARRRLDSILKEHLTQSNNVVIEAPTSLGKTHAIATTSWRDYPSITGGEPVIHFHRTTEARDAAHQLSRKHGGQSRVLLGREDACPVAAGDYDKQISAPNGDDPSEWLDWKCDVQDIPFSKVHEKFKSHAGDLPCTPCQGATQWAGIPRDEEGRATCDIIHTTTPFAYVPALIENANLVFDEQPSFIDSFNYLSRDQFRLSFSRWVQSLGAASSWEDIVSDVVDGNLDQIQDYKEILSSEPDEDYLFSSPNAHTGVTAIGRAVLNAEKWSNDRMVGEYEETSVVIDHQCTLRKVLRKPNFCQARCIIGLDAYPVRELWQLQAVDDITVEKVLSEEERQEWRRNERQLTIRQVGDNSYHVTNGWYQDSTKEKARRLIEAIRDRHGDEFQSCVCSKSIKSQVQMFMEEAGIEDPKIMHYGVHKSRNDFRDESVGLVLGCIDPGDDDVFDKLALGGYDAAPEYDETGDDRLTGRGFVGPDSDAADAFLASVRRHTIAQAAGRYARSPGETGTGATVYVWTDVLPGTMVDDVTSGVGHEVTEKQQEVYECIREQGDATTSEIFDVVSSSRPTVLNSLEKMNTQGVVTVHRGSGPNPNRWFYKGGRLQRPVEL